MSGTEIQPPWIAFPGHPPRTFFWREAGQPWLDQVWRPFWANLSPAEQAAYLAKFVPPREWVDGFFDASWDAELEEIDRQDAAYLEAERNRRAEARPAPSWLRRVARWLGR